MFDVVSLQRVLPVRLKFYLKPYYRKIYPNKLHVLFWPTFRCNYRCSYCPVCTQFDFSTVFGNTEMARRIAAILLLEPALDANYEAVKADTYVWQQTPASTGRGR
jgi:hypothetical protein